MNDNDARERAINELDTACPTCGVSAELVDVLRKQQHEDGYKLAAAQARIRELEAEVDRLKGLVNKCRSFELDPQFFQERRLRLQRNLIGPQWYATEDGVIVGNVHYTLLDAYAALDEK